MFADCESAGDLRSKRRRLAADADFFAVARENAASGLPPLIPMWLMPASKVTAQNPGAAPSAPHWSADAKSYCQLSPVSGEMRWIWVGDSRPKARPPARQHAWTMEEVALESEVSFHSAAASSASGYKAWASDPFGFCHAPKEPHGIVDLVTVNSLTL